MYLLQSDIIKDLQEIICEEGKPSFTLIPSSQISGSIGGTFNFIPSITLISRELDRGGFNIVKLLTATVPISSSVNGQFVPLFQNGLPMPQQIFSYSNDGKNYRIESVKPDPTNSYVRIIAHSTTAVK